MVAVGSLSGSFHELGLDPDELGLDPDEHPARTKAPIETIARLLIKRALRLLCDIVVPFSSVSR
jgi:hypothetical protein